MAARALLLDVTRLISRIGKGALTGIDRVELAYTRLLPKAGTNVFGLLRTGAGVLLLPSSAFALICDWADGTLLPQRVDLLSRVSRRGDRQRAALETALRSASLDRVPLFLAGRMLRRHLPQDSIYLNVGHANLTERTMRAIRVGAGMRVVVMLHDVIPLDFPQFARPDQVLVFARKLNVISRHADLVIHTAAVTRKANERRLAEAGRVPHGLVLPLGVSVPSIDPCGLPEGLLTKGPYFVVLGTIEPRKNHALLLDVWEGFANMGPVPRLLVLGNRGWADPTLMQRLDSGIPGVEVYSGLSDGAVSAIVAGARALVFPTWVEGYGLPALEAAALGTAVIASDLPILRELLGEFPVYLDPGDRYSWSRTILDRFLHQTRQESGMPAPHLPSWEDHIRMLLTSI